MKNPTSNLRVITLGRRNGRFLLKLIDKLGPVMAPWWSECLQGALDRMTPEQRGVRMVVTTHAIDIFRNLMNTLSCDELPGSTYESLRLAFRMASSDVDQFAEEIESDL